MAKRTKIIINSVRAEPTHDNKGVKIDGSIYVNITVRYGRYKWDKTYMLLEKELQDFNLDDFKQRVYKDSRLWIKQKDLETATLEKLKVAKDEIIYLD